MNKNILNLKQKYVVAVSGGPDSMYLLDNLRHYFINNLTNLLVAHINYNKRTTAERDESIVRMYCAKYQIKFFCLSVSQAHYQKYFAQTHNFQTIARTIRYDYFYEICQSENCIGVLVAHNYNDLIETYLIQQARGNIVEYYGLNEISRYLSQFTSQIAPLLVFRPMLKILRSKIINYLVDNKIIYGIDETNELEIYQRNKIRKKLDEECFSQYLTKIINLNEKIKHEQTIVNNFFVLNSNFNLKLFISLNNIEIQQRILYRFFQNQNAMCLIANKKKRFLSELIKQLSIKKNYHSISINHDYLLIKSDNSIAIVTKQKSIN